MKKKEENHEKAQTKSKVAKKMQKVKKVLKMAQNHEKSRKSHLGALDSRRLPRLLAVSQAPGKARRETPAFREPPARPPEVFQASCGFLAVEMSF